METTLEHKKEYMALHGTKSESQDEPLLDHDLEYSFQPPKHMSLGTTFLSYASWSSYILAAALLYTMGIVTVLTFQSFRTESVSQIGDVFYTPVGDVVQTEKRRVHLRDDGNYSPYAGPPTAEQNASWNRLLMPTMIVMHPEEMEISGEDVKTSAQLVSGEYISTLGVYHDLHCLQKLRWYLYPETFYPAMTPDLKEGLVEHLDHCLDSLRMSVSCTADLGVYSYWLTPDKKKLELKSETERSCMVWEPIYNWAYDRRLELYAPTWKNGD